MFYVIILLMLIGIVLSGLVNANRKALAIVLLPVMIVLCDIMVLRWEVYIHSSLLQRMILSLLFIIFVVNFTYHCRKISSLLKFELVVSMCMVIFNILSVLTWKNMISVDSLWLGQIVFLSPLYVFFHKAPWSLLKECLVVLLPLLWSASVIICLKQVRKRDTQ